MAIKSISQLKKGDYFTFKSYEDYNKSFFKLLNTITMMNPFYLKDFIKHLLTI
jgi:hypothetical protein